MDAVLEDATIHQRRQTLRRLANSSGLDDAYSTTLNRMQEQKKSRVKLGMEAQMWISHSERPLKVEELCHALAVEVGATELNVENVPSIRTLLSCTLGLVTVDEQASTVRLIHFTLQEYLEAQPNWFITPHSMMAEICLTYLNFHSICELSTTLDIVPLTAPFLHYASCHWGFHARQEMTETVKRLALRLFQRDSNHISVDILLRGPAFGYLPRWGGHGGRRLDIFGVTGLHCISYMGITEVAIDMVNMERWDLNGRDWSGATPLMWAIRYGNYPLAKLLLEQEEVDPGLSDRWGRTPLTHAAEAGQEEAVRLLLERGDVNPGLSDKDGRTPLSYAAGSGHEGMVKILLERGVNPDPSDSCGRTPLSYAAGSEHEGVMKIFLGRGDVNPNSSDKLGLTPLSYAAKSGHESVVKILLEREDVDPDPRDEDGRTLLSYVAGSGYEGVVKILLEREDVDPNPRDEVGRTPLSYAAESGHEDVVKMLLERMDVNPNSSDKHGMIPLSYATESGHEGVVRVLLERGDLKNDSPDLDHWTLLSPAPRARHSDMMRLLSERRPNPAMTQEITPEEVELGPVSQQTGITSNRRYQIRNAISLLDKSPVHQVDTPLSPVSTPAPMSDTAADTAADPDILWPSRPLKSDQATPPPLPPSKRKRFPFS